VVAIRDRDPEVSAFAFLGRLHEDAGRVGRHDGRVLAGVIDHRVDDAGGKLVAALRPAAHRAAIDVDLALAGEDLLVCCVGKQALTTPPDREPGPREEPRCRDVSGP
jgi:hypothetical protein